MKEISSLAKESFASHILIPEQIEGPVKMWLCRKPGTGMYHFRVVSAPGALIVYGDVGDNVIEASDKDLIPWLRGAIHSPDYLIEKIVNKQKKFDVNKAIEVMEELRSEATTNNDKERLDRIQNEEDNWDDYEPRSGQFQHAVYNLTDDVEIIDQAYDWDSDVYWTVECLKKFVELLDKP